MTDFKYYLYKLPKIQNIYSSEFQITKSNYILEPLISLGFYYYLHQSKDKMEILNNSEYKNKDFYLIVNNFEHKMNHSKNDIEYETIKYLNLSKQEQILSRAFYKLWEIISKFKSLNYESNIKTVHLAEGPGSFVQATMLYRDKYFSKYSKKDQYCAITLVNKDDKKLNLNKKKIECFTKDNINRYYQHRTSKNDNGDLTKLNVINNFVKEVNGKAEFITADGGFFWKDENYQEQEAFKLILGEIITALKIQKENGTFILKIFDIFTNITIKLICLLAEFYEDISIFKPFTSRISNSEKYIICEKFKNHKNYKYNIDKLEKLLEECNTLQENEYLCDIISNYTLQDELKEYILTINKELVNKQFIEINKIITYINNKNYFGDEYHKYKENQLKASKFWVSTFLK